MLILLYVFLVSLRFVVLEYFQTISFQFDGTFPQDVVEVDISVDTASLITQGKLQTNCEDLRFFHKDKQNLYKFWIESGCNRTNTIVWIELDLFNYTQHSLGPLNIVEIFMKYGDPSISSGEEFFDGHFIFPSTSVNDCSSLGSGWLSFPILNDFFPRGTYDATHVGANGGSLHHVHDINGGLSYSNEAHSVYKENEQISGNYHPHTHYYHGTTERVTNLPNYIEVVFCKNEKLKIIEEVMFMFAEKKEIQKVLINAHESISLKSEYNDFFIRGVKEGSDLNVYEDDNSLFNNHTYKFFVEPAMGISVDSPSISGIDVISIGNHTHFIEGVTKNTENLMLPPFIHVYFASASNTSVITGNAIIVMSSMLPPLGYTIENNFIGRFPRGTSNTSLVGTIGGIESHSHRTESILLHELPNSTVEADSFLNVFFSKGIHSHVYEGKLTSEESHVPPFRNVLFMKRKVKKGINIYISSKEQTWIEASDLLDIIDDMSGLLLTIFVSLVITSIIFLISMTITTFIIFFCIFVVLKCWKQREYYKEYSDIRELLDTGIELKTESFFQSNEFKKIVKAHSKTIIPIEELRAKRHKDDDNETQLIAEGSTRGVWLLRSYWTKISKYVVIKACHGIDESDYEEIKEEIMSHCKLNHPNILTFYGVLIFERRLGFVVEYCANGDVAKYLKKFKKENNRPLEMHKKVEILQHCIEAVNYLHQMDMIHRDIKPANILLTESLNVRLADFGSSKITSGGSATKTSMIGTTYFRSPECILSSEYTEKTDVYSFGITCYEILCERKAFKDTPSNLELHSFGRKGKMPSFKAKYIDKRIQVPLWIQSIVQKCWSYDPNKRPSFGELVVLFQRKEKMEKELTRTIYVNKMNSKDMDGKDYQLDDFSYTRISEIIEMKMIEDLKDNGKLKYYLKNDDGKNDVFELTEDNWKKIDHNCMIFYDIKK